MPYLHDRYILSRFFERSVVHSPSFLKKRGCYGDVTFMIYPPGVPNIWVFPKLMVSPNHPF